MSLALNNRYFLRKVGLAALILLAGLGVVWACSGEAAAVVYPSNSGGEDNSTFYFYVGIM